MLNPDFLDQPDSPFSGGQKPFFSILLSCSQSTVLSIGDPSGWAQAQIFRMPTAGDGA
jgi:hypothetical protein